MRQGLHDLTGVYALDALPEDEQAMFEEHLEECDACREEVAEMRATLGDVGAAFEEAPPAGLKDRVLAQIDQTPQDAPLERGTRAAPLEHRTQSADEDTTSDLADDRAGHEPAPAAAPDVARHDEPTDLRAQATGGPVDELAARRRTAPWWSGMLATAAAIVAVLVVGVSLLVANLNERIDELESARSDMAEMLAAPDAQTLAAEGPGGSFARVVMSTSRGEAMFVADGMDPAPQERTYELWLIDDEGAHSVGLLDVDDSGRVTQRLSGDMERAAAIGVTVEPEGGSPEPTTDPIMLIELADA